MDIYESIASQQATTNCASRTEHATQSRPQAQTLDVQRKEGRWAGCMELYCNLSAVPRHHARLN